MKQEGCAAKKEKQKKARAVCVSHFVATAKQAVDNCVIKEFAVIINSKLPVWHFYQQGFFERKRRDSSQAKRRVSEVKRSATSFRPPEDEAKRLRSQKEKQKRLAPISVSPFVATAKQAAELAEAKGFEPLYRLLGNRISSAGRYNHFDTLP